MNIVDMIFYWSRTDPHRPALIQPELVTTYEALADAIELISERIERFGLDRSEPVAVSLANPSFFIAAVFALLGSGYSAALVSSDRFSLLRPLGIRNLISDTQGLMLSGGRNMRFDMSWLPNSSGPRTRRAYGTSKAEANLIFFTSGTTGLPKKITQSAAATDQMLKYPVTCASGHGQKIVIMPGLNSTLGFNRLCEVLDVGKTACFAMDSEATLSLIAVLGADVLVASPAQALSVVRVRNANPAYRVNSLKTIFVGGGKMEPESVAAIRSSLCRDVINQYGSTEAGVVGLTPFDVSGGSASLIPLPWAEVQVVDVDGNRLPAGEEGMIRYRTPQLQANLKLNSADILGVLDGWFYPGDLGALTADGMLCLRGRTSDVINRGGVKVSGTRIEEVLKSLPGITDAAACGIVGPSGLEEIWIAILVDGPTDFAQIKASLRNHTDIGVAPDELFVFDEFPRAELGKVQKYRLKELMLDRKRIG